MTRKIERQAQELDLRRDLIPAIGMTGYLVRVFRDLDIPEVAKEIRTVGLNTVALVAYNVAIGLGIDYLTN